MNTAINLLEDEENMHPSLRKAMARSSRVAKAADHHVAHAAHRTARNKAMRLERCGVDRQKFGRIR